MTTAPAIRCGTCTGRHATVAEVRDCSDDHYEAQAFNAQARDEIYAEAVMSWVMGGGAPEDASVYANVIASGRVWNGGIPTDGDDEGDHEQCEHGLSARLCVGPSHYPLDDHND
jgi:hypothetical protein